MAAIGSTTLPVYIDAFGEAQPCSREIPEGGGGGGTAAGGVITGELYCDTNWIAIGDGTKTSYEYIVQNDSLLAISIYDDSDTGGKTEVLFIRNGSTDTYLGSMTDGDGRREQNTFHVPVKKGTKIIVKERELLSTDVTDLVIPAALRARFMEYKLSSLSPQIAMPDYSNMIDKTADIEATGGWIATEAGYIITNAVGATNTGAPDTVYLDVNGETVFQAYQYTNAIGVVPFDVIPVSKGDVITATSGHKLVSATYTYSFAPCKAVQQTSEGTTCIDLGGGKEIQSFAGKLQYLSSTPEYLIYTATQNCKFYIHAEIDDITTQAGGTDYRYLKILINGNTVALACDPGLGDTRQREVQWTGNIKKGDVIKIYCSSKDATISSNILYSYVANELRLEAVDPTISTGSETKDPISGTSIWTFTEADEAGLWTPPAVGKYQVEMSGGHGGAIKTRAVQNGAPGRKITFVVNVSNVTAYAVEVGQSKTVNDETNNQVTNPTDSSHYIISNFGATGGNSTIFGIVAKGGGGGQYQYSTFSGGSTISQAGSTPTPGYDTSKIVSNVSLVGEVASGTSDIGYVRITRLSQ